MNSSPRDTLLLTSAALGLLAVFFGLEVADNWWPGIGRSLSYTLAVMAVLAILVVVGILSLAVMLGARRNRRLRSVACSLLIVCVGGFALFEISLAADRIIAGDLPTGSGILQFDRETWQHEGSCRFVDGDITPRQKMLRDVVEEVLPGMTRAEIEEQLGPSLDTSYFRTTGRDVIYVTGPERGFIAIDSEWLLIWLDENGRFERYGIYTD